METKIIKAEEYYINYYGKVIDIMPCDQLFILSEDGSGYGDQSYWCAFTHTYGVYRMIKKSYGKELERVGSLNEYSGTDGCGFSGEVMGQKIKMIDVICGMVFMHIFARD